MRSWCCEVRSVTPHDQHSPAPASSARRASQLTNVRAGAGDVVMGAEMRKCKVCGATKPLSDFAKWCVRGKHGRRRVCQRCWQAKWTPVTAAHAKRYYHEQPRIRAEACARVAAHRRADPNRRTNVARRFAQYQQRHPDRVSAQHAVQRAVRSGKLVRRPCEVCGATRYVHGHHDDYTKPLDVVWLCRSCHLELHRRERGPLPDTHKAKLRELARKYAEAMA